MPHYKVTYFDATGRAEAIRLLFVLGGVEFEDVRIKRDEWLALKPSLALGQLPILTVDGEVIGQSHAQARYVARELGFYGETSLEAAKIDMYLETAADMLRGVVTFVHEKDPEKKEAAGKVLRDEHLPKYFPLFEAVISSNPSGFIVGNKISVVDVVLFTYLENMKKNASEAFAPAFQSFPALNKFFACISKNEKIVAWRETRGQS